MSEPDEVRRLADLKLAQEEADRITQQVLQDKIDAAAENAKKLQFRNPDGSVRQPNRK